MKCKQVSRKELPRGTEVNRELKQDEAVNWKIFIQMESRLAEFQ